MFSSQLTEFLAVFLVDQVLFHALLQLQQILQQHLAILTINSGVQQAAFHLVSFVVLVLLDVLLIVQLVQSQQLLARALMFLMVLLVVFIVELVLPDVPYHQELFP